MHKRPLFALNGIPHETHSCGISGAFRLLVGESLRELEDANGVFMLTVYAQELSYQQCLVWADDTQPRF
jgi:hypothetical protein